MFKQRPYTYVLLTAALLFPAGGSAQATISHTWVSSTGNDANACTRSAPCATFAGAYNKTSAGGEIDVVDAGNYGPVTISQSVSIEAVGVLATIQVTSGNAITVNTGANDVVVLRGLTLDGQGTASDGIRFTSGGTLYIEDSRIHRFTTGIDFLPTNSTSNSNLFVTDTIVRNNGSGGTGCGVYIQSTQGLAVASIDGLRTENNVCGVKVQDSAHVTIRNSVAANNGFSGFSAVGVGNLPKMLIESSITAHNGTNGVSSAYLGTNPVPLSETEVRLSNVTVVNNQTGLAASAFNAKIISFGNNKVDGNSTNGSPTSTVPPM